MLVIWCLSTVSGRRFNFAVIIGGLLLALIPVQGLSLSDLILSLNPVFSVGSIVLLFHVLWKRATGATLLSEKDVLYFAAWNVIFCICLYSSSLGFVDIDLYPLGYGFSVFFIVTAVITIVLLLLRSPLAYIFILYIAVYDLSLLASNIFFDYIADAVLFIISFIILVRAIMSGCRKKTVSCSTRCCQEEA